MRGSRSQTGFGIKNKGEIYETAKIEETWNCLRSCGRIIRGNMFAEESASSRLKASSDVMKQIMGRRDKPSRGIASKLPVYRDRTGNEKKPHLSVAPTTAGAS